jgi:endoglucanase
MAKMRDLHLGIGLVCVASMLGCSSSSDSTPSSTGGSSSSSQSSNKGGATSSSSSKSSSVGGSSNTSTSSDTSTSAGGATTSTSAGGSSSGTVGGSSATSNGSSAKGGSSNTSSGTGTAKGGTTNSSASGTKNTSAGDATSTGTAKGGATSTAAGGATTTSAGGATSTAVGGATTTSAGGATAAAGASSGGTSSTATGPCAPVGDVISDFEDSPGKGTLHPVPTSATNGYWYSFKDDTKCSSATQIPTAVKDGAVASAELPASEASSCNKYAMHSSISGCTTYSGFGAALAPEANSDIRNAVDVSAYDGITFKIKAGGDSPGPVVVELQTKECVPASAGGTAVSSDIDQYQCHGMLLTSIPKTWTQMYVPFGIMGPRSIPAPVSGKKAEPPPLVPANLLAIQFALEDPYNQKLTYYNNKSQPEVGAYDVWIDDLALYKGDDGLAKAPNEKSPTNPFPVDKEYTGCKKPTGAKGKFIVDAYNAWKANFVTGTGSSMRVVSPEIDNGATVSEGIAYGMLIAVYMGDKTLFDGLWGYWQANIIGGNKLMTWKIPGGTGSATDADEDAAFAVMMASKQWPSGGYDATGIIGDVWAKDIDSSTYLPKGGSNYDTTSGSGNMNITNASYFAPAFYREFAKLDKSHDWGKVVDASYAAINGSICNSNGLIPAWCHTNCTVTATNRDATDKLYQYDSHRIPLRLGIDACWNDEAKAKTYLTKVVGFFDGESKTDGLSSLWDVYDPQTGNDGTGAAHNSMSLIGCAGVGAMAIDSSSSFRDRTWEFVMDGAYTPNPTFKYGTSSNRPGYTYYNATVGMLTALVMTGNFYVM